MAQDQRITPDVGVSQGGVLPDAGTIGNVGANTNQQQQYTLNATAARQLGEWLTNNVATVAGWENIIPRDKLHVNNGKLTMLAELVYGACVQYHHTGRFPADVGDSDQQAMRHERSATSTHEGGTISS